MSDDPHARGQEPWTSHPPRARDIAITGIGWVLLIPLAAPGDVDSGDIIAASASAVAEGTELRVAPIGDADPRGDLAAATDGAPVGAVLVTPAPAVIRPLSETTADHITADLGQAALVGRLNRALDGDRLAFFCVFGSAAASWGSVGMAARAATEGALDAISADRAAHHQPVQRIRWMPGSDTGELGRRDRMLMEDSGLLPLDEADVAEALDVLVRTGCPEADVARVDEPRYAAVCRDRLDRAFLSQFDRGAGDGNGAGGADGTTGSRFAAELAELGPDTREERVLDFVLEQVVEVLGEEAGNDIDPDQGFFDLGMDSVMSLALKTRLDRTLGGDLSATLVFEFPTTRALARHLLESVNGALAVDPRVAPGSAGQGAAGERPATEDRPEGDEEADYDDLSDDELMDRLMASVGRSRRLLGDE
jgi:acyl carrier protein